MVRMVEDLLRNRLGRPEGFASSDVTVVDPAAGTGTFLFRIVERIARWVEAEEGLGAVGPPTRLEGTASAASGAHSSADQTASRASGRPRPTPDFRSWQAHEDGSNPHSERD